MAARPEILCFGADPVLNGTRRLILLPLFDVCVASTLADAAFCLRERRIRLILLCHTLSADDARSAVEVVRALHPNARILALEGGHPRLFLRPPHQEVRLDGPADLLRKIAAMTGVPIPDPVLPATRKSPRKSPPRAE